MKKAAKGRKNKNAYIVPLFWVMFAAVIILLFVINLPLIRQTVNATRLGERITGLPPVIDESPAEEPVDQIAPAIREEDYPSLEEALAHLNDAIISDAIISEENQNTNESPRAETETRERPVYFMRMDSDGVLVRVQEKRQLSASSSPLLDTINVLLAGTQAAEESRGLTTLIPEGTVLINAAMRGSTAVLNFNEKFMFNNYGAEGYLAQLRQIVWTATEFPSVKNVLFLVEGQRVDFLGDNIRLDKPISRDDLGQL
jgi:spore germination protein GerM